MNEQINERTNEWTNEQANKWMKIVTHRAPVGAKKCLMKASLTKVICVRLEVNLFKHACICSHPAVFRFSDSVSLYKELLYPVEHPV